MLNPYQHGAAITPSDATIQGPMRAIYVGGAGNLVLEDVNGTQFTLTAVPVGSIVEVQVKRVRAATTATLLVALS
jgi:hypothetical protein